MTKIHLQELPVVWETSASIAAGGSAVSSSLTGTITGINCDGYARITGMVYSSASSVAGSGLRIKQSADRGTNYDYSTDYAVSACSGSAFSNEIVGNFVKIEFYTDGDAADFRAFFQLRPI